MDLKSGYPYWAIKNGLMNVFPPLREDVRCEVAIVGGGITGALIAREFVSHGYDTCVVEQRDIAWGSTAASTALLQYEIDTHLVELAKLHGIAAAEASYVACHEAVDTLADIAREVRDVGFSRCDSLYYASHRWHRKRLQEECAARRRIGIDVRWLDGDAVRERFDIDAPGALLSTQSARVDPYRFASRLFAQLAKQGAAIFDRTCVTAMRATSRRVVLETAAGPRITAGHVIFANGYAAQAWLKPRVAHNRSSYAFISDPIDPGLLGAFADTVGWETARPYLYFRTTEDGRLIVGGEDDPCDVPNRRDRRVERKARKLCDSVQKLMPQLHDLFPAFSWAGTFAETEDGLPFFGPHEQHGPRVAFAMAYGGNGITYSAIGAPLLRAWVERKRHPLKSLFGFERLH